MLNDLRYNDSGDVRLCFRDTGSGPSVVFLHGVTASLGVWDSVVLNLGNHVRAIAIDQRGHGRSDKPISGYGAEEYYSDVLTLVADLECAPVVLVGHSLGARNAVVLGAKHPEVVAAVVAIDYTPFVESHVVDELETRVRGGDREFGSSGEVEEYLRERYPLMPTEAIRRRVSYGYTRTKDKKLRPLADPSAMVKTVGGLRQDFDAEMRGITVPLTLLRGEYSRIVSRAAFAATQELRPDLRMVDVPGLDHYVPEEDPVAVADEIGRAHV